MTYASVNGIELYYQRQGAGRPLVLLHGGLMTIELNFGELLPPLSANRDVIAVELQGHGRTPLGDRPMAIESMADDVVALLDHLDVDEADLYGFSLGGLVACAIALRRPDRVGRLVMAAADPYRPPGREGRPLTPDLLPTPADFEAWQAAYEAVAPDPSLFDRFAEANHAMVHAFPAWTADQLRSLHVPTLLVFGDRDFSPLADIAELCELLPAAQLAVLPDTTHVGMIQRSAELLPILRRFLDS
jgi:pimeloyl-ACP methyl ester carboxylesterase